MYHRLEKRLQQLSDTGQKDVLQGGRIGLEKETLRVGQDGSIAQTPHPVELGSALTHPCITTDYSEALTEFITPPLPSHTESLAFLRDIQTFVYSKLEEEVLWATSMPCVVAGETSIPIAQYGTSNAGMMKTVYRRGLGHRYGKVMQVIAGVHFNYSLAEEFWPIYQQNEQDAQPPSDFISAAYFAQIRNLQRYGWLVPYLFGASPAVCKSFFSEKPDKLKEFDEFTYYEPHATSLRLSDIGYQNKIETAIGLNVNYNTLDDYLAGLTQAIETPFSGYEKIGIKVGGEYQQLNANILQIENEYYSSIRPKRTLSFNEKPIRALQHRGVEYIELRSLDVNTYDPLGINEDQIRFLEMFMLFCLLHESPTINEKQGKEINHNEMVTAYQGRRPELKLQRDNKPILLKTWAMEIINTMQGIAELLDYGETGHPYRNALEIQEAAVQDPDKTPSARMLVEMRETEEGFFHFALRMSKKHMKYFQHLELSASRLQYFEELSENSWRQQRALEEEDQLSFEEYLQQYFAQ